MTNNKCASLPFSTNSENESYDNNLARFSTLSSNSSVNVMVGTKRDYMISHITTNNNNETLMMPTPSLRQPSSSRNIDFNQNPREELTISSSKKPRGRPLGSKNKPKRPAIADKNMRTLIETNVIEIPHGNDIVEPLINYARCRQAGIIVSRGSGLVTDVTILHSVTRTPSLTFEGPFHLISIYGSYVNAKCDHVPPRFIIDPICSRYRYDMERSFKG